MQKPAEIRRPGEHQPLQIILLGAAGTGKTYLAADLRTALLGHESAAAGLLITDSPALASLSLIPGKREPPAHAHLLLMGLDLPARRGVQLSQAAADLDLRQNLSQSRLPYSVVYGLGAVRLHNALDALRLSLSGNVLPQAGTSDRQRPWVWACDSCSDPSCERRLLSVLLAQRTA